jgi:hypothetical protein
MNNITLENLLISVDDMFNDFIFTNWKNDAINKTNEEIMKLENEYNNLGKDITLKELLEFIKTNSNFNRIFDDKLLFLKDPNYNYNYSYNFNNYSKYNEDMEHITKTYEEYKNDIIKKIVININNLFGLNHYKLNRFEKLKIYLNKEYLRIVVNHFNHIDIWFKSYLEKFKYKYSYSKLHKFQGYIYDNFVRYVYSDLWINENPLNINNTILSELLVENNELITKRNSLNNSINIYKKHKKFFENL